MKQSSLDEEANDEHNKDSKTFVEVYGQALGGLRARYFANSDPNAKVEVLNVFTGWVIDNKLHRELWVQSLVEAGVFFHSGEYNATSDVEWDVLRYNTGSKSLLRRAYVRAHITDLLAEIVAEPTNDEPLSVVLPFLSPAEKKVVADSYAEILKNAAGEEERLEDLLKASFEAFHRLEVVPPKVLKALERLDNQAREMVVYNERAVEVMLDWIDSEQLLRMKRKPKGHKLLKATASSLADALENEHVTVKQCLTFVSMCQMSRLNHLQVDIVNEAIVRDSWDPSERRRLRAWLQEFGVKR